MQSGTSPRAPGSTAIVAVEECGILRTSYLLLSFPDVCRWNTMPTANIRRKISHISIQLVDQTKIQMINEVKLDCNSKSLFFQ